MPQLDLFSALQSSTEGTDTEFKSARGVIPGSFWASYAAMTNTQGVTIVLGVPDAAQLRTVVWNQLHERHKISGNLLRDDDVRFTKSSAMFFVHQREVFTNDC